MRRPAKRHAASPHGPGLLGVLGRSPAALAGYLGLHRGLAKGRLSAVERCLVALAVAQRSGSSYCLSVQTRLARRAGLTDDQILAAREGCAADERQVALLFLAGRLVINRGELADADIAAVRQAGVSDAEIVEAIGHVALNLAAASISHAARLEAGFPSRAAFARLVGRGPVRMSSTQEVTEFFKCSWRPLKLVKLMTATGS